jgi:hypothetical protein
LHRLLVSLERASIARLKAGDIGGLAAHGRRVLRLLEERRRPDRTIDDRDRRRPVVVGAMWATLERLPADQRAVIVLRYFVGLRTPRSRGRLTA